jgi:hypothetical protein
VPRLSPSGPRTWVTLSDEVADGTTPTFAPSRVPVFDLQAQSATEGSAGSWQMRLRYHSQITLNTCVTLDEGTRLYVRGIGNQQNADRSGWMTLQCEEAETP